MKTAKHLFRVTLPWAYNDSEQGDYCVMVWAKDAAAAILATANMMASERTKDTPAQRKVAVNELVAGAGPYAAEDVAHVFSDALKELLAGPRGKPSKAAQTAHTEIVNILTKRGVLGGFPS